MKVRETLSLRVGRLGELIVEPGRYLYVGSAYGSGGIAARVARHLRPGRRRLHWHIDYLNAATGVERVWAVPHGNECEVLSMLLDNQEISVPFVGFGSSDCGRCAAHLILASDGLSPVDVLGDETEVLQVMGGAEI